MAFQVREEKQTFLSSPDLELHGLPPWMSVLPVSSGESAMQVFAKAPSSNG